ncbi:Low molecular weight phosphotyrosine protein phosphatase [Tolypocladium ophioglossoides CBS 100239]|uniref:Low molecular weight phosphotyrosine protein phosphatase n=1 Tax=Tolypocladium ophioglossoides (strain CBS 100239) TaxID=1163406 RepID=A0A0L0N304_TOLOC|nr:Low molecular weight phosphotyrosine protein phosphatase [Tolypocladium ophioglossoides CBS 100239]
MAEGIFQDLAKQPRYKGKIGRVDSCGTAAYHTGDPPDSRTLSTLEDNGITDYDHSARRANGAQFLTSDFEKFDYIFAMDRSNLSDLQRLQRGNPDGKAQVMLFGEFGGGKKAEVVDDPYYGGRDGFEKAFEQCKRFAGNFLKEVVGE